MPDRMSDNMTEYMSDRMSDRMPGRIPDRMLEKMSDSQHIPDKMWDRCIAVGMAQSKVFSQNSVATLGVLTIRVKAWCSFEVVSYVCAVFDAQTLLHLPFWTEEWTIRWPLQHKSSLIFRFWRKSRTKRWLGDLSRNPLVTLGLPDRSLRGVVRILRSLAQHTRHFGPLRSLSWWRGAMRSLPQPSRHFEFGPLRSLSLWRGANFAIARATLLPLWASQIALVVARCEFIEFCDRSRNTLATLGLWDRSRGGAVQCDRSRNLLVTLNLGLWDRSRCGAVRILRSLVQHCCHFGPLRSLSWWRGANFCDRSRNTLVTLGLSDRSRGGAVQCDRSRNLLVTLNLGLWDRSRCGAVRILRSLAQHTCHFGPLRSLSWWCGANLYRILRSLAQHSFHFGPLRSLSWWRGAMRSLPQPSRHFEFGPLRSLSLWRGANFAIARATLLLLWASQIALVVARCEFIEFCDCSRNALVTLGLSDRSRGGAVQCDRSRNLLVTLDLGLWDRSRCGAVRILRSLAQHSCHFGPLRSLSWYRILRSLAQRTRHFEMGLSDRFVVARRATFLALWACQIALVGALCWFCYIPYLSRRSCATETSYKDLVHRPLIEILYCLLQRSCQEVSSRTEILPRELFWRASTEIS